MGTTETSENPLALVVYVYFCGSALLTRKLTPPGKLEPENVCWKVCTSFIFSINHVTTQRDASGYQLPLYLVTVFLKILTIFLQTFTGWSSYV